MAAGAPPNEGWGPFGWPQGIDVLGGVQRQLQPHADVGARASNCLAPLDSAEAPTDPAANVESMPARDGAHSTESLSRVGALGCVPESRRPVRRRTS
jgi:hypothetical protein